MNLISRFLSDPAHWAGSDGIWARIGEHLAYTGVTLLIAMLIAVPLGLWIGHTGRAKFLVTLTNGARSLPTLGLLFLAILLLGPTIPGDGAFLIPAILVLVILAVPPILAGVYAGVEQVDPVVRDAARAMGMTGREVLTQVEMPMAMPLACSGIRSAALQVVATATVAASVSVGGLGRFLIDGQAVRDYGQMATGAILVALLALVVDGVFALLQRLIVSPGLQPQRRTTAARAASTRWESA